MFSKTLLSLSSLAVMVLADSTEFGLMTLRSASPYHFLQVFPKDGELIAGSSEIAYKFVVTDSGDLKIVNDGTLASIASDNTIKVGSTGSATKFFIKDGYLQYDTLSTGFSVDTSYQLLVGSSGTGVSVRTVADGGALAPDFIPSGDSTTTTTTLSPSSDVVTSTTSSATSFSTVTPNSNTTQSNTLPPVSIEEGAANYLRAGANVAGLAAVAALLL
ncbi:hypothetical protein WICPIJ_000259 [Wickerhamomyces pijperi]|uniref:Secreted protein n=1 Tax=Wickerhamomyces pijperi TaxID=599730 RepID=A0A9P8QH24_WICPI|nr:hypothetical protein WICPIJ_000259 [Wickerhamomyces pijperi]